MKTAQPQQEAIIPAAEVNEPSPRIFESDNEKLEKGQQIDPELRPKPAKNFDYLAVSFNLINCCIGAGVLSLGKIMATTGILPFCIYMFLSVIFCYFVFWQISSSAFYGNFSNLADVMRCLYGKVWAYLTDISILMINIGFLIAYISVSADYVRDGIAALWMKQLSDGTYTLDSKMWQNLFKLFATVIFMIPLSLMKSVNAINYVSSFAIVFVIVAIVGLIIRYEQFKNSGYTIIYPNIPHNKPDLPIVPLNSKGIIATIAYFTTFFTIYSAHASMVPVQKQIDGKPADRFIRMKVSFIACLIVCCIVYCLVPFLAVNMFDRKCTPETILTGCIEINSNILLNFGKQDKMMVIMKLLYAIVVLVSFPCMLFPVRECIMNWFGFDKYTKKGYMWFVIIGLIVTIFCCAISILIPQIDEVFSIAANIFGIILVELVGLMLWYKMSILQDHSLGKLMDQASEDKGEDTFKLEEYVEAGLQDEVSQFKELNEIDMDKFADQKEAGVGRVEKGDKYELQNLEKASFSPSLAKKIVFYTGSTILVCFNISAIVCDFSADREEHAKAKYAKNEHSSAGPSLQFYEIDPGKC